MSNSIDSSESVSAFPETRVGLNYRAVIDTNKCTISGECIKVCEVNAIYEGPKRMPSMTCFSTELLPGKSVVDQELCNGCGECVTVCPENAIEMVTGTHGVM
jgi:NAD-dependent dihydropyrimidine dehydrogenase PreA subunit